MIASKSDIRPGRRAGTSRSKIRQGSWQRLPRRLSGLHPRLTHQIDARLLATASHRQTGPDGRLMHASGTATAVVDSVAEMAGRWAGVVIRRAKDVIERVRAARRLYGE